MLPQGWTAAESAEVYCWGEWEDRQALAQRLFAGLRDLDARGVTAILCPLPEARGLGLAIRDRLEKAARSE
jgi:L-threonylcarbamoyladenylate synthase